MIYLSEEREYEKSKYTIYMGLHKFDYNINFPNKQFQPFYIENSGLDVNVSNSSAEVDKKCWHSNYVAFHVGLFFLHLQTFQGSHLRFLNSHKLPKLNQTQNTYQNAIL